MSKIYTVFFATLTWFIVGCSNNENRENNNQKAMETAPLTVNDIHTYAQPEEVVIKHLDWVAEVDFENKKIRATASLTIEKSENARYLILDTKGLNIEKVTLNEAPEQVTFTLGDSDPWMGSPLMINIESSTSVVHVHYATGEGAEALQWLVPQQTSGGKHPFLFTQSQAILARSWVPVQDSPGIRFTYTAKVKVPSGLIALMSAENPVEKSADGLYSFTMNQPIPAYLLALAVGDLTFQAVSNRTGVYAEPAIIDKAVYEFGEMEEMVQVAESLYGPYQWDRYDLLVLPPSFPFGGMENPRLTFATPTILAGDRSLTSLVAHELAHSWSGNLVTNGTWNDFWINEGFTVYFEHRIMEELYGRDYSEMLASLAMQDLESEVKHMIDMGAGPDTRLKLDLTGRNPDDGVTSIAYNKGYFFLRQIEESVGREVFDGFLKKYFADNAFKVMTTERFVQYMNENLIEKNGLDPMEETIRRWIYEEGLPAKKPVPVSGRFDRVNELLTRWAAGAEIGEIFADNASGSPQWSTHEWLHFLRHLPEGLTPEQMKALDDHLQFSESGNAEILAAWFKHVIRHRYEPGYPQLEKFLVNTGRRKFLMPLYSEMIKTSEGKQRALAIYEKARPNYHFVSTNSLDALLDITL